MRRRRKVLLFLAVLLAVALALNTVSVNTDTKPAKADTGRILKLPGDDVQVAEDGDPGDPPIVLIHCYTCNLHWFDAIAPLLARRHHVIRIDLLGHGGSAKPRHGYSMQEQAQRVALALGRLSVEGATVVGHSMGAAVATELASRYSQLADRVVIVDLAPSSKYDRDGSLVEKLSRAPVVGQALWRLATDGTIRKGYETAFAKGFRVPDFAVGGLRAMTYSAYKSSERETRRYRDAKPLDARMTSAAVPLLAIFGSEDRIQDPAALDAYRTVPGARVAKIPGAGHSPQIEKPEQTARLIEEFAAEAGDEARSPEHRR